MQDDHARRKNDDDDVERIWCDGEVVGLRPQELRSYDTQCFSAKTTVHFVGTDFLV